MVQFLKKSDHKKMLWKNGLGTTDEIEIFPGGSDLIRGDFLWRLSAATINGSNDFSLFPDYQRLLVVWSGAGLKLNEKVLLPWEPLEFKGKDSIHCVPLGNEVKDLGLIYRKSELKADLKVYSFKSSLEETEIPLRGEIDFIICGEGSILVEKRELSPLDVFKVSCLNREQEKNHLLSLVPISSDSKIIQISISNINSRD